MYMYYNNTYYEPNSITFETKSIHYFQWSTRTICVNDRHYNVIIIKYVSNK